METLHECDADNAAANVKYTIKHITFLKKSIFMVDKITLFSVHMLTALTF